MAKTSRNVCALHRDMEYWRNSEKRQYWPAQGDNGLWGVDTKGALIYEPDMTFPQAELLAFMEEYEDPEDYAATLAIIAEYGIDFESYGVQTHGE